MTDDAEIRVRIVASLQELNKGLSEAHESIRGFGEGLKELGALIGISFGIEGIKEFVQKMAELGEETERVSKTLGVSTEFVGTLNAMAAETGISVQALDMSMTRLAVNLSGAAVHANAASESLQSLGLNASDLLKLNTEERFKALAEAFSKVADGATKTEIGIRIFGRSFNNMIPFLNEGAKGVEEFTLLSQRAGTQLSEGTVHDMDEMNKKIAELSESIKGVLVRAFIALQPEIKAFIENFTKLVQSISLGDVKAHLDPIIEAFRELGHVLTVVNQAAKDYGEWGHNHLIMPFIEGVRAAGGLPSRPAAAMGGGSSSVAESASTSGWEATVHGPQPDDPAILAAQRQMAIQNAQLEQQLAQQTFALQSQLYNEDAANFGITQQQKFELLKQAQAQEYAAEVDALNKQIAINHLDIVETNKLENMKLLLAAQEKVKESAIDNQALAKERADYLAFFSTIQVGLNSVLTAWLSGTSSMKDAWRGFARDMTLQFISAIEQMIVKLIVFGAIAEAINAATGGLLGGMVSLMQGTGSIGGLLGGGGGAVGGNNFMIDSEIGAHGPTLLNDDVTIIPSFDTGSWYVPKTGLAYIHEGEMILPPNAASAARAGGGGGPQFHFHGPVIGTKKFFEDNGEHIARAMQKQVRNAHPIANQHSRL